MQLNPQEIATLRRGERLEVDVPEIGGRCIVLRSDDLFKLVSFLGDGHPMEIVTQLVDHALAEDDVADPWLASYQSCRP